MKYDHILLDVDNTLLDFDAAQDSAFKALLKRHGAEYSPEIFELYSEINHGYWHRFELGTITKEKLQGERFEVFFDRLGIKVDGDDANNFYQEALCFETFLMPDAVEVCRELSERGKLTIVTNGVGTTAHSRINSSGFKQYISHIIVSELIGYAKPSIQFFDETFKTIGKKEGDKVIIVGDSLSSDIKGGINAGIDTCWFNLRHAEPPKDIKIDYIITELKQLLDFID